MGLILSIASVNQFADFIRNTVQTRLQPGVKLCRELFGLLHDNHRVADCFISGFPGNGFFLPSHLSEGFDFWQKALLKVFGQFSGQTFRDRKTFAKRQFTEF